MSDSLDDLFELEPISSAIIKQDEAPSLPDDIKELEAVLVLSNKVLDSYKRDTQKAPQDQGDGFDVIVTELSKLLNSTNTIIDGCKYTLQSEILLDAELINATTSIINTSKDIIKEFLKLFKEKMKFQQTILKTL